MKSVTAEEVSTLKLTVSDAGVVWYLDGAGLPSSTGAGPEAFLASSLLRGRRRMRVVGTAANAGLIVGLCEARARGRVESLQVCSPMVCESAEGRKDPALTLFYMRAFAMAASLGGWHEVTCDDTIIYAAADRIHRDRGAVAPVVLEWLAQHSAWPAVLFINGAEPAHVARLMTTIIDPRWYIDQDEPNRGGRLEQYLGLNPKTMRAVMAGETSSWLHDRCRNVLRCWSGGTVHLGRAAGTSTSPFWDDCPSLFLWRVYASKKDEARGFLAASKKFICYLRHNWLSQVANRPFRGQLFLPTHFFERPDEVEAYNDHMLLLRRTRQ